MKPDDGKPKRNVLALFGGILVGLATICALFVAILQLWQSSSEAQSQKDLLATNAASQIEAQNTLVSILGKQLDVQAKIATLQSNAASGTDIANELKRDLVDLQSTATAVNATLVAAESTSSAVSTISSKETPLAPQIIFVPGNMNSWLDINAHVVEGQVIVISASGTVRTYPDYETSESGPDGQSYICQPMDGSDCIINGIAYGTLVARIGKNPPFKIGSEFRFLAPSTGQLYFIVNDNINHYYDNTGGYQVIVTLE